jgi:glycosyltransferase involved in cell wall biosynthesis
VIKIGINGRFLWDDNLRGFNRYAFCLLKALEQRDDVEVHIYADARFPVHDRFRRVLRSPIHHLRVSKSVIWQDVALPAALRRHGIHVFHAPADGGLPIVSRSRKILSFHHAPEDSLRDRALAGELDGPLSDYVERRASGIAGFARDARSRLARRIALRCADRIIAVSEFGKRQLRDLLHVPEPRINVTYLAPDEAFFHRLPPSHTQAAISRHGVRGSYLLFVGGYDKRKNVGGLLQVHAELRAHAPGTMLVLAARNPDSSGMKSVARSLGLVEGHDVLFLERIEDDLPALYQGATAFITLSWEESFCLPVVEAMASGTPVVASRFGAIPEVAAGSALLVDPRDTRAVVSAVSELLTRVDLQEALRDRGLRCARGFSWHKTAEQTVAIYREVLHERPRRASAALL